MEMPETCETCRFRVNNSPTNVPDWICGINQWPTFYCRKSQNHADEDKYLQDCPIICSLPEGHGRLVDADKLADNMKARKAFFGRMSDPQCLVEDAPIIVPAERGEV
jgi:hypothetical protein